MCFGVFFCVFYYRCVFFCLFIDKKYTSGMLGARVPFLDCLVKWGETLLH